MDAVIQIPEFNREELQRQAAAIKASVSHCSQPVSVSGNYSYDTGEHSLLVTCACCNHYLFIDRYIAERNEN